MFAVHNIVMTNKDLPGAQVYFLGQTRNYKTIEPVPRASKATMAKQNELTLESRPWVVYAETVIKYYFVPRDISKGKVELMGKAGRS